MDRVKAIADAVLYEGYVLWPYRRSALKNRRRFTFGGVHPEAYGAAHGEPSSMHAECLIEGGENATIDVQVRFLHVVERQVMRAAPGGLEPVDALEVGGERYVSWEEATEREIVAEARLLDALRSQRLEIRVAKGTHDEPLADAGRPAGVVRRSWRALEGSLDVRAERLRRGLWRVTATVSNTTPWGGAGERALPQTFCSTHIVLHVRAAEFVSLTDPPEALREAAEACVNRGCWPSLAGEEGDRSTLLASPIILPDHAEVAPESPGDLFDATEIDQMLVLNILSMTDEEKREMRACDPKAREILERTEALTPDQLMRLHGAIREFGMVRER